jgi:predicted SAM-dependent methyltransferase
MSLRSATAEIAKSALTTIVVPIQRRRAAVLEQQRPLRLNLGSADDHIPGWVGIDLLRPGRKLDLYWDLRRGLPFKRHSVDAIAAEHLFEHLTFDQGVALMRECLRVLAPGGVLRISVPDLERYVASYLGQDDLIDQVRPGRRTRALALGEVFFLYGHQCMYDFETLERACTEAGFATVERSSFGQGRIQPSPDTLKRRPETLYVDAVTTGLS